MKNLYSIGELIDKLIIENIKIFNTREKLHKNDTSDKDYVEAENKMNILNENRGTVISFLDRKINDVQNGADINIHLKNVKTYYGS
jgi:thermostable 8-oxoguanine DNA glycosylase